LYNLQSQRMSFIPRGGATIGTEAFMVERTIGPPPPYLQIRDTAHGNTNLYFSSLDDELEKYKEMIGNK